MQRDDAEGTPVARVEHGDPSDATIAQDEGAAAALIHRHVHGQR